jgi:hypothetical protein
MNKNVLSILLIEELEAALNEEELDENFFKKMAAKLRGAKDGGWEAVAAQGDDEEPSSRLAGTPDQAKIPLRTLIGKLVTAGLPQEIAVKLFREIDKQLTTVHGFSKGSIKEQAGALKGVAAQPSARRTSNMPSRRGRSLDLAAVKIPKNMAPDVKNILQQMFSKFGLSDIRLGIGPPQEPQERTATPKASQPDSAKVTPDPEKETPSRIDLLKPPRSTRDLKGSENYKKFMASLLDFFANQMKIDIKIAKKIVKDIWAKTPTSGKFNKLVFKEQMEKEIDIAAILANSGLNPAQQIKVLGALKKWAAQNSDLIDNRMTQILRLRDKKGQKPQPATKSQTTDTPTDEEETEVEKNFDAGTGLPISEEGRDSIIKQIGNVTKKEEFYNLYDKLAKSKFSNNNRRWSFNSAHKNKNYNYLSGFDAGPEAQNTIRQKFKDLFLTDEEETSANLKESLMVRWKTIAGIK